MSMVCYAEGNGDCSYAGHWSNYPSLDGSLFLTTKSGVEKPKLYPGRL